MATATLTKWGNSQGILIPKTICETYGLMVGDEVMIVDTEEYIKITPVKKHFKRKKVLTSEDVFASWEGSYERPADLPKGVGNEVGWGEPVGKEMW